MKSHGGDSGVSKDNAHTIERYRRTAVCNNDEFYWRAAIVKINRHTVSGEYVRRRPSEYNTHGRAHARVLYDDDDDVVCVCITRARVYDWDFRAVNVWKCEGSLPAEDLLAAGTYRGGGGGGGRRVKPPLINYDRTIVATTTAFLLPLLTRAAAVIFPVYSSAVHHGR